jgi:glycosyltransferase involved in cell wall biosynthesis
MIDESASRDNDTGPSDVLEAGNSVADLAVIILCLNEKLHLGRALRCVAPLAKEVFVIDSFSTDDTIEIARAGGAIVLQNKFVNHARQFQWALENAPITAEWIMKLDADEVIEGDLAAEIEARLPSLPSDVVGINLKRKHIFLDRWIRHGGRYPLVLLRIWRRGHGEIENRWMDEHVVVKGGRTVTFEGGFADHNLNDLTFFTEKHNAYATREAIEVLNTKYALFDTGNELSSEGTSRQAALKRWGKNNIYNRLPFWLGPLGYFLFRYVIQLGFLDGREGLIYHFLQGFWYRFLVGAKVAEFDRVIGRIPDRNEQIATLSRLTGHRL